MELIKPFYYCGDSPEKRPIITEEWRWITDKVVPYVLPNRYLISNFGNVYSIKRQSLMAINYNGNYRQVMLYGTHGKTICARIDRLVMMTFYPIENMDKMQVNHRDTNTNNDCIFNLEWCTPAQNTLYADMNGSRIKNYKNINKDILENIAIELRDRKISQSKIAKKYNVSIDVVEGISMGKHHKDLYDKYNLSSLKGTRPHVSEISIEQIKQMCNYLTTHTFNDAGCKNKKEYFIKVFNVVGCYKDKNTFTDSNCNFIRNILRQKIYKDITMNYNFTKALQELNL